MSRFYIILLSILFSAFSFGQQDLKRYLAFAEQKFEEGDYVYALTYYQKAMKIDSSTIDILWGYAEALRAYKDYPKAAFYYGKIYDRESAELYPSSLLNYGLMLKQCGRYDEALSVFQLGKKKYRKDRRGYLYRKSRQEIKSCLWAKSKQGVFEKGDFESLPEHINSVNAEFGHRINDNKFYFSSLRADSISEKEEVYDTLYKTHLYSSKLEEGTYKNTQLISELAFEGGHTGNGSFSLDKQRFYFSYCEDQNRGLKCKILVAYVEEDRFVDVDTLGVIINAEGANTTMPFIGEWEEKEVLFFASDREGGRGGMDLWYSFIKDGNQFQRPRNIRQINTIDNELSPFWNSETQTLFFSSTWYEGFGGYDVFKSEYTTTFQTPVNLLAPVNSPANDLYYFETQTRDTSFVSSNRLGSNFSKNPTCCSDIYSLIKPRKVQPPTIEETLAELNQRLPVTLYFHNDIPNPRSLDTTTTVNYLDSYEEYTGMLEKYQEEYAKGLKDEAAKDAKDDIEDFFTVYVRQGVEDLNQFIDLLQVELEKGRTIELTVKGFASPLAKSDYNVNLTKRRIASMVNYLSAYENGVFKQYLDKTAENGGEISIIQIPFGDSQSDQIVSDNPNDQKNSVYSRAAASERKIEIQSVDVDAEKHQQGEGR